MYLHSTLHRNSITVIYTCVKKKKKKQFNRKNRFCEKKKQNKNSTDLYLTFFRRAVRRIFALYKIESVCGFFEIIFSL